MVYDFIFRLPAEQSVPSLVCRTYADDLINSKFADLVPVYTGRSVTGHDGTATTACYIPPFEVLEAGTLSYRTTILAAKLCANKLALELLFFPPHPFKV